MLDGKFGQAGEVADIELLHQAAAVRFDSLL
jgi:hypothetical protein